MSNTHTHQRSTKKRDKAVPKINLPDFVLQKSHKSYLLGFYPQYNLAKASKGTRIGQNGKKYVWEILDKFLDRFCLLSKIDKDNPDELEAYREAYHGKIYNWFNNSHEDREELSKFLSKVEAPNLWYADFPSITENAITKYLADNKDKKAKWSLALFRSTLCSEFANQPELTREAYAAKAKEKAAALSATSELLTGAEHQLFLRKAMGELMQLVEKFDKKAGIVIVGHISHEAPPSNFVDDTKQFQITSFATDRITDYLDEQDNTNSGAAFSAWLAGNADRMPNKDVPPAVYPDRNAQNQPRIPPLGPDPRLAVVRNIYHDSVTATYHYCGGSNQVPWSIIIASLAAGEDTWFLASQLPDPSEAPFVEPRKLKLQQGLVWVPHLAKRQNGAPPEQHFQFRQTFGSSKPPPEWSCALRPFTTTQHRGNTVYVLRYDGYIERSQAVSGIIYHKRAWEWLELQREGPPLQERWKFLPTRAVGPVNPIIPETEVAAYESLFQGCWDEISTLVVRLVALVNKAEELGPATPTDGLWRGAKDGSKGASRTNDALPLLFPQTMPLADDAARDYIKLFWFPIDYFQSARKSLEHGTFDYMEQFMEEHLDREPVTHGPSGTFIGGDLGSGWLVRAQVMLLANLGASLNKFAPPVPAPEHYQLDRVNESQWKRALGWAELLAIRLTESNDTLAKTSDERLHLPEEESTAASPTQNNQAPSDLAQGDSTAQARMSSDSESGVSDTPITRAQPARASKQPIAGSLKRGRIQLVGDSESSSSEGSDSDMFNPETAQSDKEDEMEEDMEEDEIQGAEMKGSKAGGMRSGKGKVGLSTRPKSGKKRKSKLKIVSASTCASKATIPTVQSNRSQYVSTPKETAICEAQAQAVIANQPGSLDPLAGTNAQPIDAPQPIAEQTGKKPEAIFPSTDWDLVPAVLISVPLSAKSSPATSADSPERHVFGPFLTPEFPPSITVKLSELSGTLDGWRGPAEDAISTWYENENALYSNYGPGAWNKAGVILRKVDRSALAKACIAIIIVHRDHFKRAQESWRTIQNHHLSLANHFYILASMLSAMDKIHFPERVYDHPQAKVKSLATAINKLQKPAFTLQFILQEIDVYERFSAAWSKALNRAWSDRDLVKADDARLFTLVQGLAEWKSTASKQLQIIAVKRQFIWDYWYRVRRYKSWMTEPPSVKYIFGTPGDGWMGEYHDIVEPVISLAEIPDYTAYLRDSSTELEELAARLEACSNVPFRDMVHDAAPVPSPRVPPIPRSSDLSLLSEPAETGVASDAAQLEPPAQHEVDEPGLPGTAVSPDTSTMGANQKRARESTESGESEKEGSGMSAPGRDGESENAGSGSKRPKLAPKKGSIVSEGTVIGKRKAGGVAKGGAEAEQKSIAKEKGRTTTETEGVRKSARTRQLSARARGV